MVTSTSNARQSKRQFRGRTVATLSACLSVIVIAYAPIGRWISQIQQDHAVSQYSYVEEQTDTSDTEKLLQSARDYNSGLSLAGMVDPYSESVNEWLQNTGEIRRYERELRLDGTDVMSWLSITTIGLAVPVYHGTSAATLKKGAGHLFGSSLPVGGPGTRSIITAHSGLPEAKLFSSLSKVSIGDTIAVNTMGQKLRYQVIESTVIEPTDVEGLGIVPGRDLLTLITCTPPGVNTYRLVVTAERIGNLADDTPLDTHSGIRLFPWWVLSLVLAPIVVNRLAVPKVTAKHKDARLPPQHRLGK